MSPSQNKDYQSRINTNPYVTYLNEDTKNKVAFDVSDFFPGGNYKHIKLSQVLLNYNFVKL